jgi:hypothetical protein
MSREPSSLLAAPDPPRPHQPICLGVSTALSYPDPLDHADEQSWRDIAEASYRRLVRFDAANHALDARCQPSFQRPQISGSADAFAMPTRAANVPPTLST